MREVNAFELLRARPLISDHILGGAPPYP